MMKIHELVLPCSWHFFPHGFGFTFCFCLWCEFGIWSLLSLWQTSMNVTWATGCAGTANVSTWSAATSVPVTRDTNPRRTDSSVLVSAEHLSDCFLSDVLFFFSYWSNLKVKRKKYLGTEPCVFTPLRHWRVYHWERWLWDFLHQLRGKLWVQLPQWIRPDARSKKLHR